LGCPTMARLREIVPEASSIAGNPLDMWQVFTDTAYLGHLIDMAEEEAAVDLIVVDRLIARNAFHMPETPDLTAETLDMLDTRSGHKPIAFVVDSEGGDSRLAADGATVRAAFGRAGYAAFPSIGRAARALSRLYRYYDRRKKRN
jgi:acyl-CoA synthetase (NDP forming)